MEPLAEVAPPSSCAVLVCNVGILSKPTAAVKRAGSPIYSHSTKFSKWYTPVPAERLRECVILEIFNSFGSHVFCQQSNLHPPRHLRALNAASARSAISNGTLLARSLCCDVCGAKRRCRSPATRSTLLRSPNHSAADATEYSHPSQSSLSSCMRQRRVRAGRATCR